MAHTDNNAAIPATMSAMLLTGHGDVDVLQVPPRCTYATARPGAGAGAGHGHSEKQHRPQSTRRAIPHQRERGRHLVCHGRLPDADVPRIQGADVAGRIVAVGRASTPSALASVAYWISTSTPMSVVILTSRRTTTATVLMAAMLTTLRCLPTSSTTSLTLNCMMLSWPLWACAPIKRPTT